MNIYNTMSRSAETIKPFHPPKLGLYACGLTVYDYTHLGHLRKYTLDDVLIRTLRHADFQVSFVQNVTDVGHLSSDADTGEDKLEKGAKKYGESVWDIARKFEDYFFRSMDLMGNLRPDVSCRATEHIQEQLAMVQELEKHGYTYVIEGDGVYFDTSKLDDYGKLARLNIEKLKQGARVEMVAGKRHTTDFALWKFERPGENRAMVWESPWAKRSFPGWHIECSAMGMHYLGDQIDIHTGGIDHIPVHHTNEIAQAEATTGKKPFVKYWVHHNFLQVEGEKMSKSLGNFFTIDDVLERGYSPQALRLLFLMSHYRSEMNFTWEALSGAQTAWDKLLKTVRGWSQQVLDQKSDSDQTPLPVAAQTYLQRFFDFLEDDLKTPEALSVLWEMVKDTGLTESERWQTIQEMGTVLGFDWPQILAEAKNSAVDQTATVVSIDELPGSIRELVIARQAARDQKDWSKADQVRDQLAEQGYMVTDTPEGQKISQS